MRAPNRNAGPCSRAVDVFGRPSKWMDAAISELFAPGAGMACKTSKHIGMAAAIIFIATHGSRDVSSRISAPACERWPGRVVYSTTAPSHDPGTRLVLTYRGGGLGHP